MDQLRAEIAERSPCDAASCPSWERGVCWLRANGHPAIAQWLELTLAGVRREGDHQRLSSIAKGVLSSRSPIVRLLWSGRLGWSLWFGPFMLVYVGPASPNRTELRELLGPCAALLTDDRVWLDGDRRRLADREPGVPLLLVNTLPVAQQPIREHLLREVGELELDDRPRPHLLGIRQPLDRLPESRTIVSLHAGECLRTLCHDRYRAREALAVLGPPELLSRWPEQGRWQPCFAPLPVFEQRYAQLGARCPELFRQLRAELEARPLRQAHTCESWEVFGDWLLEQGEELFAEWLRRDLECRRRREPMSERDRGALINMLSPVRPAEREPLRIMFGVRDPQLSVVRSSWLGPFTLRYDDPNFTDGFGADELQAILGRHASLLPRSRVHIEPRLEPGLELEP